MSDVVKGLAAVAEQAAEDAEIYAAALALAHEWAEGSNGTRGVVIIMAAMMVQQAAAAETAEACQSSSMEVTMTAARLLMRVMGAKE